MYSNNISIVRKWLNQIILLIIKIWNNIKINIRKKKTQIYIYIYIYIYINQQILIKYSTIIYNNNKR